jgi:uncharacterized Ntn-hydrolase superfamily protein
VTFSLLGRCARTGRLGMVVSSSSPAVAARCAHPRPGVGIAASQNVTDPRLGPALLDALGDPREAIDAVRRSDHAEHRQLAVLDVHGRGAAWSGARALGVHGTRVGDGCVAAGNLLASEAVLDALLDGFAGPGTLAERLLAGLRAGLAAGGEAGPLASAGILIAEPRVPWPVVDLRVDLSADPIGELCALHAHYAPLREDYVIRALDPDGAPAFGVPGDE